MVLRNARRPVLAVLLAAFAFFAFAGAASAQTDDYTEQPAPVVQTSTPAPVDPADPADPVVRANDDALPVTGSDVIGLAVVGGVLVMAGGVVLTARRRVAA